MVTVARRYGWAPDTQSRPTNSHNERGLNALHRCSQCGAVNRRRPAQGLVEAMWADGYTAREIGEALGNSRAINVATLRARGYDLPHRRPNTVEHARRDGAARLANARTAKARTTSGVQR